MADDLFPPVPPLEPPEPPFRGLRQSPEPPPPELPPSPWKWVIPVVAVVAVVAIIAALVLPSDDGGDDVATATTEAPGTTATAPPESTTTTEVGSIEEVVADISRFVESQRGLAFKRPVTVELADEDDFERRLLEDLDEDRDDIEETEGIFQALGFLDADVDLFEEIKGLLGAGVVGFYDPETEELVVRGVAATPYTRRTMAHELTHALDDQWFDVDRPDLDDADDERGFGFGGLVEGNAVRVEEAYEETFSDDERAQAQAEELALVGGTDFTAFPRILLESIVAPYQLGPRLVQALLANGGEAAVNEAFGQPPTTSEQLLDPELYLQGQGAVPVDAPAADGEVFDQGAFGAFTLQKMLEQELSNVQVAAAVDGWGGDAYVAWRDGDRTCLRTAFVGDTSEDTSEIRDALQSWAQERGAEIIGGDDGQPVTFTRCA